MISESVMQPFGTNFWKVKRVKANHDKVPHLKFMVPTVDINSKFIFKVTQCNFPLNFIMNVMNFLIKL